MLGSIIGDIIGSTYELRPVKRTDFPLFPQGSRFTDDSVLTAAVAEKPAGYLPVSSSGNVVYYVRLGNAPGYELTMDRIRYMLILLP